MDNDIILNKILNFLDENSKDIESRKLVIRNESVLNFSEDLQLLPEDVVVTFYRKNFSNYISVLSRGANSFYYTAEEWLDKQGFNSTRLLALMDLEKKLEASNLSSEKASAVRDWLNEIISIFSLDSSKKNNWLPAPYSFEETVQEILTLLRP